IVDATLVMYEVLRMGGFTTGGLNFDAKVRRASFTKDDLLIAHIAGMDTYAAGLRIAAKLWKDQVLETNLKQRYRSYTQGIGKDIVENKVGFKELSAYVMNKNTLEPNEPGKQEWLESIINQYMIG
ncbi:MAG: xylose isomerase, partial [Candidatus Izemoplasmatales bacterium]|nr:xylose isomerase [Candidatus Izemoplasmatales bacterium]